MIDKPVGLTTAHGEEARWHVAPMWGLPPPQQSNGPGHLPGAEHAGFCRQRSRVYLLLQNRPEEGVPPDIPKTAIMTLFGLFEFTRMTFGMRNAGNTFQRLIDCTLSGVENASHT